MMMLRARKKLIINRSYHFSLSLFLSLSFTLALVSDVVVKIFGIILLINVCLLCLLLLLLRVEGEWQ